MKGLSLLPRHCQTSFSHAQQCVDIYQQVFYHNIYVYHTFVMAGPSVFSELICFSFYESVLSISTSLQPGNVRTLDLLSDSFHESCHQYFFGMVTRRCHTYRDQYAFPLKQRSRMRVNTDRIRVELIRIMCSYIIFCHKVQTSVCRIQLILTSFPSFTLTIKHSQVK